DKRLAVPVTVIHAAPNLVLRQFTQAKDGYSSIQVAYGEKKATRVNRPDAGQYKGPSSVAGKALAPRAHLQEFRLESDPGEELAPGCEVTVSSFEGVSHVDVSGTSKGKGTQGVMKRHNFKGSVRTHGTHEFFRHGGSIGTSLTPGHVLKGKKMPGRMGNERVTTQNLRVQGIDAEKNLLFIVGAVPGARGGLVEVRPAVKKS
ncbi:MAG: 50S ribosomal protein L3, partial [Myxococcota bacterium]|nr:50S ribosomal protein L3 [Myxococcota bacterium]